MEDNKLVKEIIFSSTNAYRKIEEKISTLEKLSGRTIDELIDLFLRGYTLQEPTNNQHFIKGEN